MFRRMKFLLHTYTNTYYVANNKRPKATKVKDTSENVKSTFGGDLVEKVVDGEKYACPTGTCAVKRPLKRFSMTYMHIVRITSISF